jgi:hypothetical protein
VTVARLTWRRVILVASAVSVVAWLVAMQTLRSGSSPAPVPWTVPPVLLAAGALALRLGWRVKQFVDGKRPGLDPLQAARTAMFAQACAYCGAGLAGAYVGYAIALLPDWSHQPRREVIIAAGIAAAAAALLCAAGWLAERWCTADGGDKPRRGAGTTAGIAPG